MSEYREKADTERCYFCPKRTDIEVHHIVPQKFNGSDSRENLVALCDRCHEKIEQLYDKQFYKKLGIADESGERKNHFECITCSQRACVKLSINGMKADWFCVDCAIKRVERGKERLVRMYGLSSVMDAVNVYEVTGDRTVDEVELELSERVNYDR